MQDLFMALTLKWQGEKHFDNDDDFKHKLLVMIPKDGIKERITICFSLKYQTAAIEYVQMLDPMTPYEHWNMLPKYFSSNIIDDYDDDFSRCEVFTTPQLSLLNAMQAFDELCYGLSLFRY